jgi:hypothetical protein
MSLFLFNFPRLQVSGRVVFELYNQAVPKTARSASAVLLRAANPPPRSHLLRFRGSLHGRDGLWVRTVLF